MTLMEEVLQWKNSLDTTNINNNFDIMDVKIEKDSKNKNVKKVLMQCKNGHNPRWMRFSKLKQGQRCAECTGNIKYTIEHFNNIIKDKFNDEWEILSEYKGIFSKLTLKHKICGHSDEKISKHINEGMLTCRVCNANGYADSHEDFVNKFNLKNTNNEYLLLNEYKNSSTKIKLKHVLCDNIYDVLPKKFLAGDRCPYCAQSKGEKTVSNILKNNNINYIPQMTFEECKFINKLRFDFAILDSINAIKFIIEYQGEGHYYPICFNGIDKSIAEDNFKSQIIKDKIKEDYCKNNNIPLYHFHYKDFKKLEEYIKFLIKKYNIR